MKSSELYRSIIKSWTAKSVALAGALLLGAAPAWAGALSGYGYITEINMPADGNMIRIRFSEAIQNPDGCGGAEFYIRELGTSAGSNRFVATLLTAYTAKKRVQFWISGCTQNQWWSATRPQLYDVYVDG